MTKERLTILLDGRISAYVLEPVLAELLAKEQSLYLVTYPEIMDQIALTFPELSDSFVDLRPLERLMPLSRSLHVLMRLFITPANYSNKYASVFQKYLNGPRVVNRWITRLSKYFPKSKPSQINRRLGSVLRLFTSNVLPSSRVLLVTLFNSPHLLCARGLTVFTLVESWDHAFKWPMGFTSDLVFVWNTALGEDWRRYQGDDKVEVLYPLKLRYLSDIPAEDTIEEKVLLYPMSMSSISGLGDAFAEELSIAEAVCRAAGAAGWRVRLKPKPNGRSGELNELTEKFEHVSVASYGSATKSTDYFLDDHYNADRISELCRANIVLNLYTTFALDSALANRPVLQIDLSQVSELPVTSILYRNQHIQRYFLCHEDCLFRATSLKEFERGLASWLSSPDGRAVSFTNKLRDWLLPEEKLGLKIQQACSKIT